MRSVRKLNKSRKHGVRKHRTSKHHTRSRKHRTRSRKHHTRKHHTRKHRSRKHRRGGGWFGTSEQKKMQKLRNSGLLIPSRSNPGLVTVVRLQPNEVAPFDPQSFLTWLENQNNIKIKWNNSPADNKLLYTALRSYSRMQANNSNIARDRQITDARYNVNQQQVFGNSQGMSTEAYGQMMYDRT